MYEQASERWSPVQSVEKVILSVISMLAGESSYSFDDTKTRSSRGWLKNPTSKVERTLTVASYTETIEGSMRD